jgi:hypothetical protein
VCISGTVLSRVNGSENFFFPLLLRSRLSQVSYLLDLRILRALEQIAFWPENALKSLPETKEILKAYVFVEIKDFS